MSYFLLLLAFLMLTKISIFDLLIDFVNLPYLRITHSCL